MEPENVYYHTNFSAYSDKSYGDMTTLRVDDNATNSTFKIPAWKKNNSVIDSSMMFAAGAIGNLLALLVLMRSGPGQKRSVFYRLVAGLTITDLFGTTVTSPVVIAV
jgi:hypothetical protein